MRERLQQMEEAPLTTTTAREASSNPVVPAGYTPIWGARETGAASGEALVQSFFAALSRVDTNRIMQLWQTTASRTDGRFSDPNYDDVRTQNRSFESMASFYDNVASVTGGASATRVTYSVISRDLLTVLSQAEKKKSDGE